MAGGPVTFQFKDGYKPHFEREPRWGPAAKQIMTAWAEQKLKSGQYELAPDSAWASRIHIAKKYIQGVPKAERWKLRYCSDLNRVNLTQKRATGRNRSYLWGRVKLARKNLASLNFILGLLTRGVIFLGGSVLA